MPLASSLSPLHPQPAPVELDEPPTIAPAAATPTAHQRDPSRPQPMLLVVLGLVNLASGLIILLA